MKEESAASATAPQDLTSDWLDAKNRLIEARRKEKAANETLAIAEHATAEAFGDEQAAWKALTVYRDEMHARGV